VGLLGCHPELSVPPDAVDAEIPVDPAVIPTLPSGFPYEILPGAVTFASSGDLYTFDAALTTPVLLLSIPGYQTAPAWSPDGRSLAFTSAMEGPADLYLISLNSEGGWSPPYNLTESPEVNESTPEWSPDGSRLVYTSFDSGIWSLRTLEFVYNEEGRPSAIRDKLLTYNQRFQGHPSWSPAEPRIAFTSERGDRWEILITDPTGLSPSPLSGVDQYASTGYPAWSPDGKRLAFASTPAGNWDIYVINADGTGLVQLTWDPASDWAPAWSPDGRWIAFSSNRDGVGNLFIVRDDGSETIRLTRSSIYDVFPTWRSADPMTDRDR
jgi:TolB protein